MTRAFVTFLALLLTTASASAAGTLPVNARLELAKGAQADYDAAVALSTGDPAKAIAQFLASARGFQGAIDGGAVTQAIYYDLGNAWVQAGEPARGVGAYLNALRLSPGDGDTEANLAHARALLSSASRPAQGTSALGQVSMSWQGISRPIRTAAAAALWAALWTAILAGAWIRWRRGMPWRSGIACIATAWALVSITLAVDEYRLRTEVLGVLVSPDVVVRKGNGEGFAPAFTQPAPLGSEFTLVEERPGWYCIRLGDGQSGWVRESDAVIARERDGAS